MPGKETKDVQSGSAFPLTGNVCYSLKADIGLMSVRFVPKVDVANVHMNQSPAAGYQRFQLQAEMKP